MAVGFPKKNYYRRRRRYFSFKRYKYLSYQCLKAKFEFLCKIVFPAQADPAGPAIFVQTGAVASNFVSINNMFNQTKWSTLSSCFAYYKIFGVSIYTSPSVINTNGTVLIKNLDPIYLGFLPGANASVSIDSLIAMNDTILLDPMLRQYKYYSLYGGTSSYYPCPTQTTAGGICVCSKTNGNVNDSPMWTVKVVIYVLFRRTKI